MIIDGTKRKDEENQNQLGGGTSAPYANTGSKGSRPTSSGVYVNLSNYLEKNRNGAQKITDNINNDVTNLNSEYQRQQKEISDKANTGMSELGKVREAQNAQKSALDNIDNGGYIDYERTRWNASPAQDYAGQLKEQKNKAVSEMNPTKQSLEMLGNTGGIRDYLQKKRGDRPGSAGGLSLDEFVMSQSPESAQILQSASQSARGIDFNKLSNPIQTLEQTQNELSGYDPNQFMNTVNTRLGSYGDPSKITAPTAPNFSATKPAELTTARPKDNDPEGQKHWDKVKKQYDEQMAAYQSQMNDFENLSNQYNGNFTNYAEQVRRYNALARLAGKPTIEQEQKAQLGSYAIPDANLLAINSHRRIGGI